MTDRLQELTTFVRAAETGSFSRAARELGLSQPSVSRIVSALEARLGVKLLLRTTRQMVPTEAGSAFLIRARALLHELEEAEDAARGVDSLRGVLRVAMSITFGSREVIPRLPPFLAVHPQLRLELMMADEQKDLVAEGADVAFRFGKLTDSSFGARRLAVGPRFLVAAPSYLAARGMPRALTDLARHDCVFGPGIAARESWRFRHADTAVSVEVAGRLQVGSAEGLIACAKAGLGIIVTTLWACRAELTAGALVPVLPDYRLDEVEVHAVFPGGPRPSAKVRALVDYLIPELDEQPPHSFAPALAPSGAGG